MSRSFAIIIFCVITSFIVAQSPGGVWGPSRYSKSSTIAGCYKTFYREPLKLDTLTMPDAHNNKRMWRFVDFSDIKSKKLFCTNKTCEFTDLFEIIKFGIASGKISAFKQDKFDKDVGKYKLSIDELTKMLVFRDTIKEKVFDSEGNYTEETKIIEREINSDDLSGYIICEDWFFDKHWSGLEKRLLYICPVLKDEKNNKEFPLLYLYYNECRELFSSYAAPNPKSNNKITFDELLLSHTYPCFVVKKSNVFNRTIADYKKGKDVLDEHQETLKSMHNSESDLFEH